MKKEGLIALLAGCTLAGLTACGPKITEGEVYAKKHEPERTWVMIMPMTMCNGKTCTTMVIPMLMHDDEDWILKIRKYNEEKEKFNTRNFYTSEKVYNQVRVGDWFLYDKNLAETKDPNVKRRATKQEKETLMVKDEPSE